MQERIQNFNCLIRDTTFFCLIKRVLVASFVSSLSFALGVVADTGQVLKACRRMSG